MSQVCYGKILAIEDDSSIRETLRIWLSRSGFQVFFAISGLEGLQAFRRESPDVVILDVMLPEIDGLEICKKIRESSAAPVLMLSALSEDTDKIMGLEVGADDYLAKPFNPRELVARVRALFRRLKVQTRAEDEPAQNIEYGDLLLNREGHRAFFRDKPLNLTPIEFSMLVVLVGNAGIAFSRDKLLTRVWGDDFVGDERTVDSHIRNLRKKFRAVGCTDGLIESVWGIGYRVASLS